MRRIAECRSGRARWSDVFLLLGVVFLILGIVVFALLALSPTGVTNTTSWNPWLLPLAGVFGLALIAIGLYHRRGEGFLGARR
ncbi:MAG: hypothetical protein ACREC5_08445 [Thermoplasmata archaeon]